MKKMDILRKQSRAADIFADRRFLPIVTVIAIFLIICLIGWFRSVPTETTITLPPDPFTEPTTAMAHIRKLATQYGGDFDRLSANDQLMLNAIASGHGRDLLAKTARDLKANPSGSEKSPAL